MACNVYPRRQRLRRQCWFVCKRVPVLAWDANNYWLWGPTNHTQVSRSCYFIECAIADRVYNRCVYARSNFRKIIASAESCGNYFIFSKRRGRSAWRQNVPNVSGGWREEKPDSGSSCSNAFVSKEEDSRRNWTAVLSAELARGNGLVLWRRSGRGQCNIFDIAPDHGACYRWEQPPLWNAPQRFAQLRFRNSRSPWRNCRGYQYVSSSENVLQSGWNSVGSWVCKHNRRV